MVRVTRLRNKTHLLVPLAAGEELEAEELELVAAGLLRPPECSLPDSFWEMPAPKISLADILAVVTAEGYDG